MKALDHTTAAEIVRTSPFFDADWYRETYPDVALLGMDPALHYVRYGAGLGRSPGPGFNTRAYMVATPELAETGTNPLVHLLTRGDEPPAKPWTTLPGEKPCWRAEMPPPASPHAAASAAAAGEAGPAAAADLVRGHFDPAFYCEQGAPVPEGVDPVEHYLREGWRLGLSPNRWFDPLGYTALNADVARTGINPFVHYLQSGRTVPNPFFRDQYLRHPDLHRPGVWEYGPVRHILKFRDPALAVPADPGRVCVHVHAFYTELLGEVRMVLSRIPVPFTLLVSVPEGRDTAAIAAFLRDGLERAEVVVRAVPNRGRDMAPWVVHFREEVAASDLFCHFHTKQSVHAGEHRYWFRFLCHTVLGSRDIVAGILALFAQDPTLGLVAPAYWPLLRRQPNFGQTRPEFDRLLARLGAQGEYGRCPDFPAGSFFWCRTKILAPLLAAGLALEDFPEERGQICGTLAHALERALGAFPAEAGLRTAFVAPDRPHELAEQQPIEVALAPEDLLAGPGFSVSVIVPTWNRRATVERALRSALGQSRPPAEVIVVDDGSTDGTAGHVKRVFRAEIAQGRLKLIRRRHEGVSAARNAGLEAAGGDLVAYLDSDNAWRPDYLAHVAAAFARHPNALSAYADFVLHDRDRGVSEVYDRGYDRGDLLHRNFIDLNVFSHRRREILALGHRFDPELKRLVDWDFILAVTARRAPLHIRHVAADYHLDKARLGNITHTVPLGTNMARVRGRHRRERVFHRHEPLSFAIKCPAPMRDAARAWGDLHFAASLANALERQGCRTRIDLLEAWETEKGEEDDVVLVLRGLRRYEPKPRHINFLWHISHPDKVGLEEMRAFDHVFVASYPETKRLHAALGTKVSVLLQCSDPELFHAGPPPPGVPAHDLLFVGNSRGVDRWMPTTCVERGLPVAVYGRGWEDRLPPAAIAGGHIRNQVLGAYYRSAKVVLNDHWPDMARRGFVSNRIFDAGLTGSVVLSDDFVGKELFFGSVVTCRDAGELEEAARFFLRCEPARRVLGERLRRIVLQSHTFDHRARDLVRVARQIASSRLGLSAAVASSNEDVCVARFS